MDERKIIQKRSFRDDFTLMTILIMPIAIAINVICGTLANTLKLPVFLDTIGTILAGMLAGPWVGAVTGVVSIVINAVSDPALLPYAFLAGAIGLGTGLLARRGMFTSVIKIIISIVVIVALCIGVGLCITYFLFGGFNTSGSSVLTATLISGGIPFWPAQLISQFVTEIPDKALSVVVAYLVVRGMSARYLDKFPNGHIFIDARNKQKK